MERAVAVRIASQFPGRIQLPVFPFPLEGLLHACHGAAPDRSGLSRFIKMDPVLCFMALQLDRILGPRTPSPDPLDMDAVVKRIGPAGVNAIATQCATDLALQGVYRQQGLALEWLWRRALTAALLSRELAREIDLLPPEEAYVAGLLNGIGKLALFVRTPAACAPMLAEPTQADALLEAESQVVGFDHGRIGAWLIRRHTNAWTAADAAEYVTADAPAMKNALPLTQLVWAASRIAAEAPQVSPESYGMVSELLKINYQQLRRLSESASNRVSATVDELDITAGPQAIDRCSDDRRTMLIEAVNTRAVLSSVCGELLTAADQAAIWRVLQRNLSVSLGIDALLVMDHDRRQERLIGRFALGRDFPLPVNRLQIPMTATDCLPAACHRTGKLLTTLSPVGRHEPTIIDRQLMTLMDREGMVCVPFRSDAGNGWACLILGIDRSAWPMVARQQPLLYAMAAAVGAALERVDRLEVRTSRQTAERSASENARTRRIVHEINNPLGIIKNYLKVLTMRADEHASGKEELRIIEEELNRVAELIRSLTTPSAPGTPALEPVDVNAVITDMIGLFKESLPAAAAVRLHPDLAAGAPMIASDRDRLKQVLMNLLKNAMEAMPEGGTIQVRTRVLSGTRRPVDGTDSATHIRISVCDDGPGIDEGIKNDLFNPHVTTKTDHDGLGLAIVHEAVAYLKGSLQCESVPGRGTCFHIELPTGSHTA